MQHRHSASASQTGPPYEVGGIPSLDLASTRLRNNDQTPSPMSAPPTAMSGPLLSPADRVSSVHMMRPAPAAKDSTPTAIHTAGFWPMDSFDTCSGYVAMDDRSRSGDQTRVLSDPGGEHPLMPAIRVS